VIAQLHAFCQDDNVRPVRDRTSRRLPACGTRRVVEHLYPEPIDAVSHVLVVTNACSDTVSVFGVDGDRLTLRQVVGSGGAFPTSVAIDDDLEYVLDTGNAANVQGYRLTDGKLHPIDGSTTPLGRRRRAGSPPPVGTSMSPTRAAQR
jgi:hypothetical protein